MGETDLSRNSDPMEKRKIGETDLSRNSNPTLKTSRMHARQSYFPGDGSDADRRDLVMKSTVTLLDAKLNQPPLRILSTRAR